MPAFSEEKILPYSKDQLFDLVIDINNYHKFVPWCYKSVIVYHKADHLVADLIVKFQGFKESYRSKVYWKRDKDYEIEVDLIEGPFSHLKNHWVFVEAEEGTKIKFYIEIKFKSVILDKICSMFFEQATHKMMEAFEKRAKEIYESQ